MNTTLDLAARHLPPPRRVGLPLKWCPQPVQRHLLEDMLNRLFGEMVDSGEFACLEGRRLAVEVSDMELRWVISTAGQRLVVTDEAGADAIIRGHAIEFLLLAARLEDPDTLFFQRRLEVTGDTALGLTVRNLLDRLPLEALPLPARIVLNRAARFGRRVRKCRGKVER